MAAIAELPDTMLASGASIQTGAQIAAQLRRSPDLLYPALSRFVRRRQLFSPAKGLYVAVPPEYRSWGVIPATQFIDAMMTHLGRHYYVSLLSAAEEYGWAHQAPQAFQVMIDRQLRSRRLGRIRLEFSVNPRAGDDAGVDRHTVRTGSFRIARPELLVLDLVQYAKQAGGLSNVATVLHEMDGLSTDLLLHLAADRPRAVLRRLGWLLQQFAPFGVDVRHVDAAAGAKGSPDPLSPDAPDEHGPIDRRWGLIINDTIEPDI